MKKIILPIAIAACALAAQFASAAPPPDVKEIMSKPLTDIPGKEGLVLTVTYPPGGGDEIHRHDAHAFVYVIEGSIVMQLRGAEPVTVKAGEVRRVSGEEPGCSGSASGQVTQVAFLSARYGRHRRFKHENRCHRGKRTYREKGRDEPSSARP